MRTCDQACDRRNLFWNILNTVRLVTKYTSKFNEKINEFMHLGVIPHVLVIKEEENIELQMGFCHHKVLSIPISTPRVFTIRFFFFYHL